MLLNLHQKGLVGHNNSCLMTDPSNVNLSDNQATYMIIYHYTMVVAFQWHFFMKNSPSLSISASQTYLWEHLQPPERKHTHMKTNINYLYFANLHQSFYI